MGLVCKPQIEVEDIVLEMDENNETGVRDITNTWGSIMPVVKIADRILSPGELRGFDLSVKINQIPQFIMSINDSSLLVRKSLKEDVDKCVIFIGFKDWYIKFNGIIRNTFSSAGDAMLTISGELYNELLFSLVEQYAYKEMSVTDILTDICNKTKMGLYVIENESLDSQPELIINPNKRPLNFFDWCIKNLTNNLWCIDPLYHFHVGDIDKLREKCNNNELDKFTLDNLGQQGEETDIIFTSNPYIQNDDGGEKDKQIRIDYYTINSNYTDMFVSNPSQFFVNDEEHEVSSNPERGLGKVFTNRFWGSGGEENPGFLNNNVPFYRERVNKLIGGNIIEITLKNLLFEISPFDVVRFDCYLPRQGNEALSLDEEHSGNKIVIGYSYSFDLNGDVEFPQIHQKIELI